MNTIVEKCTKSKTIVFLTYYLNVGGSEYVLWQHIKYAKSLGYNCVLLSGTDGIFYNKIKQINIECYIYDFKNLHSNENILEIINSCDILYISNFYDIYTFFQNNMIDTKKRNLYQKRSLLNVNNSMKKYIRKLQLYNKIIQIVHSSSDWNIKNCMNRDNMIFRYIAINNNIKKKLINSGINSSKIYVVPNWIESEYIPSLITDDNYEIKKRYCIPADGIVIGMITRISADKNIESAIKIIKYLNSYDKYYLLIVGDGNCELINDVINENNLKDRVIITGYILPEKIHELIKCFDLCINTSTLEGSPISLIDAMANGIHCVFPSVGDIKLMAGDFASIISIRERIGGTYTEDEIRMFVEKIRTLIDNKKNIKDPIIREYIKDTRDVKILLPLYETSLTGYKNGISFIIRARNEENVVEQCVMSIIDIADEIIFVDHLSTDETFNIVDKLSKKYPHIKLYKFSNEIPKCGVEYKNNIKKCSYSIADYYNYCLNFATCKNIIKWDCDYIANKKNLINMINKYNLRNRDEAFCVKFVGQSLFLTDNKCFINTKSIYDEYRVHSKKNGFMFEDYDICEGLDNNYFKRARKYIYNFPCFYEIKTTNKNEFFSRDSFIDIRDQKDFDILSALKNNVIPVTLKSFDYSTII